MRKGIIFISMLVTFVLAGISVTGCMNKASVEKTGDLGNKNIRPNSVAKQRAQKEKYEQLGNWKPNSLKMHNNSKLELSQKAADRVKNIPGIKSAYVMLTDHNAYVAVKLKQEGLKTESAALTEAMKTRIAERIQALSSTTENVYVSANPDFIERVEGWEAEVKQGHPIKGFLQEFNALVERIFPARVTQKAK
ncbi:MAG: YhcN/YlaJ family sporulation lipoprotein [Candidatus Cohnella colombiensis]|uniref:YhcN/YlaJ family sporulation lipoprotein n=1 Tax=Candidatus Cohnella colombiensis TaxID=3121368 RepID=A0AA95EXW3_9BACL|nr:MAG: YhcN/YlaJ family sporulation lipoprotein [Cohnella sp.]